MAVAGKNRPTIFGVMQRIRVPLGFVVAPLVLILAKPTKGSILIGSFVALCGLAVRGWASGHLRKNERLATSGPYAFTRNPLYLGTLVLGMGISICAGSLAVVVLFGALYLAVYLPVMAAEAHTMRELFPFDYDSYSRLVPLFVPRFTPARFEKNPSSHPAEPRFDSSLYLRHREYRAAIGAALVITILILKSLYVG